MRNLFLIFGLLVNSVYGQISWAKSDSIILKVYPEIKKLLPVNHDSVQIYFEKMINDYRVQNGLNKMVVDTNLKSISSDQLNYVSKVGKLTHEQPSNDKKNSWDRAKFYKIECVYTGENLSLVGPSGKYVYYYGIMSKYKSNSLSYMYAKDIFEGWKNSLGHNKNMLDSEWDSFYFDYKEINENGNWFLYGITNFKRGK